MTATILVTGATGFIGRHLIAGLTQRGYRVRAALRMPPADAGTHGGADTVAVREIGPETDWSAALHGVDAVVHLAGVAHRIGPSSGSDDDYHRVNALGTARLAEAIALSGSVRRLVLISSIAVTGSQAAGPVSERTPPAPDTPYGRSKLEAELAVERILTGTADWCALRPSLVYGPGNPGNMARLLKLVSLGIPLPLDDIPNRRSFLFVENLVDLIAMVLGAPEASRRVFAVADREVVSTTELIRLIGRTTGRPVRLFAAPQSLLRFLAHLGDGAARLSGRTVGLDTRALDRLLGSLVVDGSGVSQALGWQPPHSLEAGLRRTLVDP